MHTALAKALARSHKQLRRLMSSLSKFPYPTEADERAYISRETAAIEKWFQQPRFQHTTRSWDAGKVAALRGTLPQSYSSDVQAQKLFNLFDTRFREGKPVHTIGSIDPVQMTQSVLNQEVTYISGWACSSVLTTTNEVSPDFGDYPYDTVPNQVDRIFRSQLMHDKKAWLEWLQLSEEERQKRIASGRPRIDYLRPIIADGDTGHGGLGSVMKLAKLFAERGAAGVHLEDQLHGGKKCGHLSGKVIVPTSQHVSRLLATRFQWDIMGTSNILIARTDSESSSLLSSSIDPADHEFILGVTTKVEPLKDTLCVAEARGAGSEEINQLELQWMKDHELLTFDEAVVRELTKVGKAENIQAYLAKAKGSSNYKAREAARETLGYDIFFDWDAPRTTEGFHPVKSGMAPALKRALTFCPYADMIWLETKRPNLAQAQEFAKKIHEKYPEKWLVYNLSPSFNWSAHGFSQEDLKSFVFELAKSGFVFQLVSLAGIHTDGLATWKLSNAFKTDGMKAYVDLVQNQERETNCDLLTHQKWSGTNYYDLVQQSVLSGSSATSATGEASTERDF